MSVDSPNADANSQDDVLVSLSDALKELDGKPICKYCKGKLDKGNVPSTCLLNNMYRGQCPPELKCLNTIEMMMCRLVKCFQTIIKPGPITSKLPISDLQQAVRGRFIHLPLGVGETLAHAAPVDPASMFDNMENYMIVYGLPTKGKKVFRQLVDRSKVFKAMKKLKEINRFYADVPLPELVEDFLPDVFGGDDDDDDSDIDCDGDQRMNDVSDAADSVSVCKYCKTTFQTVSELVNHAKCPAKRANDSGNDSSDGNELSDGSNELDPSEILSQTLSVLSFERSPQSEDDAGSEITMVSFLH